MRRRTGRNRDPYFMTAKFAGTCPQTGKKINRGDRIAWWPSVGCAYHEDSPAGDEIRALEFASGAGMLDANW